MAYFDILGFGNIVESFPVEFVREKLKEAQKEGNAFNAICRFKFFSDSFIFYTENDSMDSFKSIWGVSAFFFMIMCTRSRIPHFPMRGCLNVGKFYADEENGIIFGSALIGAYSLSEGQDWIGFVLSEEARKKLEDYESINFEPSKCFLFQEYNVPYKAKRKRRKLLVYKPHSGLLISSPECFWSALSRMEHEAFLALQKDKSNENICSKCRSIFTKYSNTEDYLLSVCPSLEGRKRINQNELCAGCPKKKSLVKKI